MLACLENYLGEKCGKLQDISDAHAHTIRAPTTLVHFSDHHAHINGSKVEPTLIIIFPVSMLLLFSLDI